MNKNLSPQAAQERKTLRDRMCENCFNGHGIVGSRVYCSKHRREKRDKDVCPDHRFVREEFDLNSATPFTDWMKEERVAKIAPKVFGFSLLSALICSLVKGRMM